MPLTESSSSNQYEFPQSPKLSDEPKNLDSRGIPYGEYFLRKRIDVIPHITPQGITQVLQFFEQNGAPKNLESAIQQLDTMLSQHMKYDAMNYLLGQNIDHRTESYTATIDPSKIGLNQKQIDIAGQQIPRYKKAGPEIAEIPDLDKQMKTLNGIKILLEGPDGLLLSKLFSSDSKYIIAHHESYNGSIGRILKDGVGQCHTFAALGKLILESGNVRWKLGIRKVIYLSSPSGDHTVLEIQWKDGSKVIYDPTNSFTIKDSLNGIVIPAQKKSP